MLEKNIAKLIRVIVQLSEDNIGLRGFKNLRAQIPSNWTPLKMRYTKHNESFVTRISSSSLLGCATSISKQKVEMKSPVIDTLQVLKVRKQSDEKEVDNIFGEIYLPPYWAQQTDYIAKYSRCGSTKGIAAAITVYLLSNTEYDISIRKVAQNPLGLVDRSTHIKWKEISFRNLLKPVTHSIKMISKASLQSTF